MSQNSIGRGEFVLEEHRLIAEIGRIISSSPNIDDVFSAFAELAGQLVHFDRLAISTVDPTTNLIADAFVTGLRVPGSESSGPYTLQDSVLPPSVYEEHEVLIANADTLATRSESDTAADNRTRIEAGLKSALFAPIVLQGDFIGCLVFRSKHPKPYGKREARLARQIAAQIAGVISSHQRYLLLQDESVIRQRLGDEQALISGIGRLVSSTLNIENVFDQFADHARALIPHDRVVVAEFLEDHTELVDLYIGGKAFDDDRVGIPRILQKNDAWARLVNEQSPWVLRGDDFFEWASSMPDQKQRLDSGLRALLSVPVIWQGHTHGSITFRSEDPEAFDDHEVDLGVQIAAQVSGGLAIASQFRKIEQQSMARDRLVEQQAGIAEIGRIVSSSLKIEDVLTAFVEQARSLVPFDRIVISVVNDDLTEVSDVLIDGIGMEIEDGIGAIPVVPGTDIHETFHVHGTESGYALVKTGDTYAEYAQRVATERSRWSAGLRSMLLVPLVWQGRMTGTLNLRSLDPEAYGDGEVKIARQIAAQIAGAITTSNQVARLRAESIERKRRADEQRRIAETGRIVSSSIAIDEVFIAFAEELQQLIPSDRVIVSLVSEDGSELFNEFVYGIRFEESLEHSRRPVSKVTGYDLLFIQQKPQILSGDDLKAVQSSPDEKKRRASGLTSQMAIPLVWHGETIGLLTLRAIDPDAFGEHQKELGIQVAQQIAGAIAAANQYRMLEAALENIQTQATALEAADEGFIILKPDFTIEWVNKAFTRDTGYSRKELVGKKAPAIPQGKNSLSTFDKMPETVRSGKVWRATHTSLRKDGTEYYVDSSMSPVFDEHGEIIRFIGTRRDITEIVQAEQDREARRSLDAENRQLMELNEQREEFLSTVSHELRTPLTAIMAFADILSRNRSGTLNGSQLEQLDVIRRNSRNLNKLIEDILDFSKLSTDQLKLEKSEFEIHGLLDSVVESLEPTVKLRSQTLAIEPYSEPIWINADTVRIGQVISNLITNSSKYSPPSTRITLTVNANSENLSICVADQGHGISAKDLKNIYLPFFRSEETNVREELGTGLGLSISKTLVDLHGGSITAKSKLHKGTQVTFTLPGPSPTRRADVAS